MQCGGKGEALYQSRKNKKIKNERKMVGNVGQVPQIRGLTKGASIWAWAVLFSFLSEGDRLVGNVETRASSMHATPPHPITLSSLFHGTLKLKPISTLLFTYSCYLNQGHWHYRENELQADINEPETSFTTTTWLFLTALLRRLTWGFFLFFTICTHHCRKLWEGWDFFFFFNLTCTC